MATETPLTTKPEEPVRETKRKRDIKILLTLFAILSSVGILMLVISAVAGLIILMVAECFFAFAYLRFSRRQAAAPEQPASR